ncbi:transducin beta 2 [Brachionus plicatilis]|uniref:Transducin beta 2 n=1 Tax=Brachionus plicatilis TaxID=10195 RepID=A0A3M7Q5F9_BRAPC|nr:transducin beta 2 [Brachionus plicatilis]
MIDATQLAFTIAVATVVLLVYIFFKIIAKPQPDIQAKPEKEEEEEAIKQSTKTKEKKINLKSVPKNKETTFKHDWLSTCLKAHSDKITGIDFSSNGKYLLSCGNDRAVFLWSTKEFEMHQHRNFRCNVEFDHAVKIRFSPDSKSFIAGLGNANTIKAFKILKKEDSNIQIVSANMEDFPQKHKTNLINIGISCNSKYIMTCSKDTTFNVWNPKGDLLANIDTVLGNNNYACISPCGRFIGVCGFTPDVKIWEVAFDKTDNFKEVRRAFELKGHSAGIHCFAFNSDSSRMVSVSKDKTWRLWDTKIEYERGQDASLLLTVPLDQKGPSLIAISPDSYSVAVTVNTTLLFFNGLTGQCDEVIDNVFNDSICEISFSTDNNYLAVAGDRHVKIFRNITGHKTAIQDLKSQLKTVKTQSGKERIEQLIGQHR